MNKIVLFMLSSRAARAAPSVLPSRRSADDRDKLPLYSPTVQPMDPHRIWDTNTAEFGSGTSRIPKLEVPVNHHCQQITAAANRTALTSLRNDHVLRAEELRDSRPQPGMRDHIRVVRRLNGLEGRHLQLRRTGMQRRELVREFGQQLLHPDVMVDSELDLGVVRMKLRRTRQDYLISIILESSYLDRRRRRNAIGKVSRVEVALQRTNAQDELRGLDLLLHRRPTKRAYVDLPKASVSFWPPVSGCQSHPSVSFVVLADSSLAHRSSIHREASLLHQLV